MGRDRTTAPHNVKLTLHHARKARLACYVSYEHFRLCNDTHTRKTHQRIHQGRTAVYCTRVRCPVDDNKLGRWGRRVAAIDPAGRAAAIDAAAKSVARGAK
jgi:hypothetical protein